VRGRGALQFLMDAILPYLPHVNASLNALAALLLVAGYLAILLRREDWHKWAMLSAFAVSALFLASYLTYHFNHPHTPFSKSYGPVWWWIYIAILASHIVLAITVPFLALWSIWLGWTDDRHRHRWWAGWTLPIWLYVSVTGVIVYLMLYQFFPAR
jgi:uncharacterized membrane protein YozB (DUF420 family)